MRSSKQTSSSIGTKYRYKKSSMCSHHVLLYLLLFTVISSYKTTKTTVLATSYEGKKQEHNDQRKYKLKYPCNTVIDTLYPDETLPILKTFMNNLAPEAKPFFESVFGGILKYGVQIKTVCAGCHSVNVELTSTYGFSKASRKEWDSVCEYRGGSFEDDVVYGARSDHSGIVMIPMEEDDEVRDIVPLKGTLPAFIHAHTTKVNSYDAPSQYWSEDEDGHWSTEMFICFLATATKGVVSFAPDYMGYGHSVATKNYLVKKAYVTSFLPQFVKVGYDLMKDSDCQTRLADAAFVEGYGEGGYAALAIADGLNKALNVEIIETRAGGGAISLVDTLMSQVVNFKYDLLWNNMDAIALMSAAYSSTNNPSLKNNNLGQNLLSPRYMDDSNPDLNIVRWLDEEDITKDTINGRIQDFAKSFDGDNTDFLSELLDPSFVSYLQKSIKANVTDPCSISSSASIVQKEFYKHEQLCEALTENSVVGLVEKSRYPIHLCHSEDDELFTFDNIPDLERNPNRLSLTKQTGDHVLAGGFCFSSDVMFFTSSRFRNYVPVPKHSDTCHKTSVNYGHNKEKFCEDSNLSFEVKFKKMEKPVVRKCSFIKNASKAWRCNLPGVKEICAKSCGTCEICSDSTSKFKVLYNSRYVNRDCNWVKQKNRKGRCRIPGMRDACRETCGGC